MKRFLSFLPAAAAGLLAGWGLSHWLAQAPAKTGASTLLSGIHAPPRSAVPGADTEWRRLLDGRSPLAAVPKQADEFGRAAEEVLGSGRLSAFRRVLEMEKLRSVIPAGMLGGTVMFRWSRPEGDEGISESLKRLAREGAGAPEKAVALVDAMVEQGSAGCRDRSTADGFRRVIYREWLRTDPQAALAHVSTTGTPYERHQRLGDLMDQWARLDPAAAAAALSTLPEGGPGYENKGRAEAVFRTWHEKDTAAAMKWAETQADPAWRATLATAAEELKATDPAEKTAVLLAAPSPDTHQLASTFSNWLAADPAAAVARMAAIPAEDKFWNRDAAWVATMWAVEARLGEGKTPEEFLEMLRPLPAGAQRDAVLGGLVNHGASNDIPFAVRLVTEMGEGRAKEDAMGSLTELWMRKDPVKLSEWLATLPPSESRHAAVGRFAELLKKSDPEAAARWQGTLPHTQ